jgi:tetratricopeptide (TPR) repeat protein
VFALEYRAQAYLSSGDLDRALADYSEAIRLKPARTDLYTRRALMLRAQHKADEALQQAKAVVAANPGDGRAYLAAGAIYAAAKEDAEAMRSFDRAVEIGQSDTEYLARAQYRPRADLTGRRADIEAALKLKPDSGRALLLLADLQSDEGDPAAAIATLSTALSGQPAPDTALLTRRGTLYLKTQQPVLAQQDLDKVRARATSATALNNLCWSLATAGVELERARGFCDAALAEVPDDSAYHDSRGFVLLRLGRYEEAIAAYDEAIRLHPIFPMSLYGRGLAKRRQGDTAGADADISAALALDARLADTFAYFGVQ